MRRDRMNRSLGPPRLGKSTGTPYFLLFLPSRIDRPFGNMTMEEFGNEEGEFCGGKESE
jgi:hypothetical protein